MTRNRFRIRIRLWLALAVASASLALVQSASASLYLGDNAGDGTVQAPPAVVVTAPDSGFNWGDALVGAGVGLAIAAGSIGVVYLARHYRRTGLAT
jgi:hypothetical protein